ncbi:hypothetical protein F5Y18DRAFT_442967 [Xylariaceae sp. FL1019]|nr:hypothetical protein F5Y18DRAFT_442967 [Xylariaceae sp. FL1019]
MSSILPLPENTSRLLTSNTGINTPVSVVKELVDNAIDAKANSIEVLLSADSISKIEVRDDGCGIHPDDYDSLGRHGHTSKLRNFEQLRHVFGKTLGFRGEGLACIVAMADVTITTKILTEPTAALLRLLRNEGGVASQKATSAPVGTTVSITNLYGRLPVREQMAVKQAKKTIDETHELLRSYAMARPQLKLHFKLQHQPSKILSYSPKRTASMKEAALQVFGLTSLCFERTIRFSRPIIDDESMHTMDLDDSDEEYMIQCLLMDPSMDIRNIPNRHYFSVDNRPLNAKRGIARRLLVIYTKYIRSSALGADVDSRFIGLDIKCPVGTYDANIEPSKDEVLFSDEQIILDAFEGLCKEVYKPVEIKQKPLGTLSTLQRDETTSASPQHMGEDLTGASLIPMRIGEMNIALFKPLVDFGQADNTTKVAHGTRRQEDGSVPMGSQATGEEIASHTGHRPSFRPSNMQFDPKLTDHSRSSADMNIWQGSVDMSDDTSERVNRSSQKRLKVTQTGLDFKRQIVSEDVREHEQVLGQGARADESADKPLLRSDLPLTPEPPILWHPRAPAGDLQVPMSQEFTSKPSDHSPRQFKVPGGKSRNPLSSLLDNQMPPRASPNGPGIAHPRPRREYPPWTPPSSTERKDNQDIMVQPRRSSGLKQSQISFGGNRTSDCKPQQREDEPSVSQGVFATARRNLQLELSQGQLEGMTKPTHHAKQQGHSNQRQKEPVPFKVSRTNGSEENRAFQDETEPIATTLPTGDPRAYLLRRQKSLVAGGRQAAPKKHKRTKSSLMPFENILPELQVHDVSLNMSLDLESLKKEIQELEKNDVYVSTGTLFDGLDMNLDEGQRIESRLQELLAQNKENIREGEDVRINLRTTLKGKCVADVVTN